MSALKSASSTKVLNEEGGATVTTVASGVAATAEAPSEPGPESKEEVAAKGFESSGAKSQAPPPGKEVKGDTKESSKEESKAKEAADPEAKTPSKPATPKKVVFSPDLAAKAQPKSPEPRAAKSPVKATSVAPLESPGGGGGLCKKLERELAEKVATFGERSVDVPITLISLAKARRSQGKISAAVAHLERSMAILESITLDISEADVVLNTLTELSVCCTMQSQWDDSTALLKRALEVATGMQDRQAAAEIRGELKKITNLRRQSQMANRRASNGGSRGSMRSPQGQIVRANRTSGRSPGGGGGAPRKQLFA